MKQIADAYFAWGWIPMTILGIFFGHLASKKNRISLLLGFVGASVAFGITMLLFRNQ